MAEYRCPGCMKLTADQVCTHCGWPAGKDNESHQLPVGTVLAGKYLVGKVLGQGGFGITYLGWDMNLDIQVCIKEFYPSSIVNRNNTRSITVSCNTGSMESGFTASRERFLREAKSLARFRDVPQIVSLFDFFEMNNTAYMVMEFVKGIDLAGYIRQRKSPLTMEETLRILKPVMEALSLVHEAGLVHRDISPDNIMLHPRDGAKLLDFGAVRSVENPDVEKELPHSTEAILKNGFAPMEQYAGRGSLGPWTDVYALCATVFYCVTGRIPENAPMRMLEGAELNWQGAVGVTQWQKTVLEQGMALRAKDRIGSMKELMDKLLAQEELPKSEPAKQEKKPEPKQPVRRRSPGKRGFILAVVLVVLVVGLVAVLSIGKAPESTGGTEPSVQVSGRPAAAPSWEGNVLKADPLSDLTSKREGFTRATFLDTLADAPDNAKDLSADGSGSVLGWVKGPEIFIAGEGGINARECCPELFSGCKKLVSVSFGDAFHVEQAVSLEKMFLNCQALESVDIGGWDVSNVTNLSRMFGSCNSLTTVDISHWNTASVTNVEMMFLGCGSIGDLDLSGWNVSGIRTYYDFMNPEKTINGKLWRFFFA